MELAAFYVVVLLVWGIYTSYVYRSISEATLKKSIEKFMTGEYEDALNLISSVIEKDNKNADAHYYKGEILRCMENYLDALLEYDKTIKLNRRYTKAYIKRGITRGLLKDSHGAIKDFNSALKLEPLNKLALTGRGSANYMIKQYEDALSDFNKAIDIDKNYKTAQLCRSVLINKLNHPEIPFLHFRKAGLKNFSYASRN